MTTNPTAIAALLTTADAILAGESTASRTMAVDAELVRDLCNDLADALTQVLLLRAQRNELLELIHTRLDQLDAAMTWLEERANFTGPACIKRSIQPDADEWITVPVRCHGYDATAIAPTPDAMVEDMATELGAGE